MKRVLAAGAGAVLFTVIGYGAVELFASWYGPRYIRSDSDIGDAYMIALAFILLSAIAGGVLGFKWGAER